MIQRWKRSWSAFERAPAGERFVRRYQARESNRGVWARVLAIGAGVLLIVAGAILLVIPGPGLLVIAFGAGFLAQEFLWMAKALDSLELALRRAAKASRRFWVRASKPLRGAVVTGTAAIGAGAVYLAWTWLFQ